MIMFSVSEIVSGFINWTIHPVDYIGNYL